MSTQLAKTYAWSAAYDAQTHPYGPTKVSVSNATVMLFWTTKPAYLLFLNARSSLPSGYTRSTDEVEDNSEENKAIILAQSKHSLNHYNHLELADKATGYVWRVTGSPQFPYGGPGGKTAYYATTEQILGLEVYWKSKQAYLDWGITRRQTTKANQVEDEVFVRLYARHHPESIVSNAEGLTVHESLVAAAGATGDAHGRLVLLLKNLLVDEAGNESLGLQVYRLPPAFCTRENYAILFDLCMPQPEAGSVQAMNHWLAAPSDSPLSWERYRVPLENSDFGSAYSAAMSNVDFIYIDWVRLQRAEREIRRQDAEMANSLQITNIR